MNRLGKERVKVRLFQNEFPNADDNEAGQHVRRGPGQNDRRRRQQCLKKMLTQIEKERKQYRKWKTIVVSQFEWDSGYARQVCLWKPGSNYRRLLAKIWRQFFNCLPAVRSTLATMEVVVVVFFFIRQCRIAHITGNEKRRSIASCI